MGGKLANMVQTWEIPNFLLLITPLTRLLKSLVEASQGFPMGVLRDLLNGF